MKRFLTFLLTALLISSCLSACESGSTTSTTSEEISVSQLESSVKPESTPSPSPSSSSSQSEESPSSEEEEIIKVQVDTSYYGDTSFEDVEKEADLYGAISVEKTDKDTYLYQFYESDYDRFLSNLRKNVQESVAKLNDKDSFSSIYSLSINDDLTELTIYAESISYGEGYDKAVCEAVWHLVTMYDEFAGLEKTPLSVQVYDGDMNVLAYTSQYPEPEESEESSESNE